jgi:hypothetical protein
MIIPEEVLIVLGEKNNPDATVLSAISLSEHAETVIATYSSVVSQYSQTATLTAFFLNALPSASTFFILLQYIEDESGRNTEESKTFLELFRAEDGQIHLITKGNVDRNANTV